MGRGRLVFAGIAGLGFFGLGYLAGRSADANDASEGDAHHASAGEGKQGSRGGAGTADGRAATKSGTRTVSQEQALSRRVVGMMSDGKLTIPGVDFRGDSLQPGEQVKEFFDLSDEEFEAMKEMGRERLRKREDHEQSLAKIREASEDRMIFDVPADPGFAEAQRAEFGEEVRKVFGRDVAAALQLSIDQAYREFEFPRHVNYSLKWRENTVADNAPPEIRAMLEGMHDFKIGVNTNEDGSYMTDAQGMILQGASSSSGSLNVNDTKEGRFVPRYHYLWERGNGDR
ncbi:hypothetical protein OKA05_21105 [Luteolibacter arcticus]|uniref:Uncharacterized protein n=1 Tax=Luteolibacter arcticus TaxID=1581411 RepID=A0ABT3GNH8_9BACT|nr:hypothetical protein [Luteolibacter arcticus]MCW1925073.1 hypothetical protein [Luteolibacter arcticus]